MKSDSLIIVYGSYGYTGQLIVDECRKRNLNAILAGRNEEALSSQSKKTGYAYQVVEITDDQKLRDLLAPATVVIHCGGPFLITAKRMVEACLATHTHYTDITGEIAVFEMLKKRNDKAISSGIMILPGTGFDVIPTDCLALHLKNRLPDATNLQLAFATSGGGASRGTSKTAVLGLGEGSRIRKNDQIVKVPLHQGIKEIDFGAFKSLAARIPWGDVSTAHFSTGIPNIEVYMAINKKMKRMLSATKYFNWLLSQNWIKHLLLKRVDKLSGPTAEQRGTSRSYLAGCAWNQRARVESTIEMSDGYTFTGISGVAIANKILQGNFKAGYQTPSSAYGADLILEFEGVIRKDLPIDPAN